MDLAAEALKMAGALAGVIAFLLGGAFVVKRMTGDVVGSGLPRFRVLGTLRLGPGKGIFLVEVAGEVLVLGTTSRDVTVLTRVQDAERVEQLRAIGSPFGTVWPFRRLKEQHPGYAGDGKTKPLAASTVKE
ncbi:MAG: hypothetical protein D6690_06615 [Nitrospirae bacterium]|nr:MAG: hypothetical protein D6690_06615 [Nitrospirota bacterium]